MKTTNNKKTKKTRPNNVLLAEMAAMRGDNNALAGKLLECTLEMRRAKLLLSQAYDRLNALEVERDQWIERFRYLLDEQASPTPFFCDVFDAISSMNDKVRCFLRGGGSVTP